MSDLIFNMRLGSWHFQIGKNRPHVRISRNPVHADGGRLRVAPGWKWFEVY